MADKAAKLVSMERTAAEKKAAEERCKAMPCDGPDFPWGLQLNLGAEELKKLGIDKMPDVGDEVHIYAVAKVTSVRSSASENSESKSVELQITQMAPLAELPDADEDDAVAGAAAKMYGAGKAKT